MTAKKISKSKASKTVVKPIVKTPSTTVKKQETFIVKNITPRKQSISFVTPLGKLMTVSLPPRATREVICNLTVGVKAQLDVFIKANTIKIIKT